MLGREKLNEFLWSPVRVFAPRTTEELRNRVVDAVWAMMRRATAILQARTAFGIIARDPFVAGAPADFETLTQLSHRKRAAQIGINEAGTFFHRVCLQPRHRIAPSR